MLTPGLDIGNAKIAGMSTDLGLDSAQYEWLLRAFYITYITFEWSMFSPAPCCIYVYVG